MTVQRYFLAYRSFLGDHLDKSRVVEHLREGISGCHLPFAKVAEDFHFIEQATKTVYIPDGEGETLCETLQSGNATRETYRKAGQYSVSIYEQHYQALLSAGDLLPLDEESAVLRNPHLYHRERGLSLQADAGRADFI